MRVSHRGPLATRPADLGGVAIGLLNSAYLWCGEAYLCIDCSELVQSALQLAGVVCPGDAYVQEQNGVPVALKDVRRGDLVFWKGHVAIAQDAKMIIHANAHHMMVASEPLSEAVTRIKRSGSDITAVKRL